METWFESRRHTLFEALSTACDHIDADLAQDLERKEQDHQSALKERDELLKNTTTRLNEIQEENIRLKHQLQHQNDSTEGGSEQAESNQKVSPLNPAKPNWEAEYVTLSRKYKALSDVFRQAKDALQRRKDERDRWIDHATLLEKKIKSAEEEHKIAIVDIKGRNSRAQSRIHSRAEVSKLSLNTSFAVDAGIEQADLDLPPLAAASLESDEVPLDACKVANPQSESTQNDSDSRQSDELPPLPDQNHDRDVQTENEPSSDEPVVVSERVVRKRKRNEGDASTVSLQRVKLEPSSSPRQVGYEEVEPQESIDLGEVAQKMLTPRKRKELELSERNREIGKDLLTISAPIFVKPDSDTFSARPAQQSSVLTPVSTNRRIKRPTGGIPKPPLLRGLSHGISNLAEDGKGYVRVASPDTSKDTTKRRLDTLLNSPSTTAAPPLSRTRLQRNFEGKGRFAEETLPVPERRVLPFERERLARERTTGMITPTSAARTNPASNTTPASETGSPLTYKKPPASLLRNRPLRELRLEDFKINPLANDGHDFAFSEVVRDKSERACLSGCVDMHCCGKQFRALALSQRPNPPLTPAQRQEEQKLLEEYLGDYAYRLSEMSKDARMDLWVEAKTQELANKYGKHRHRYSRMRSPPGFWNADFPSTQELEADRVEAEKREKQSIQERHREAMRAGGIWLFRDE